MIADRSTLKTDTVLGQGVIRGVNSQYVAFEKMDPVRVYVYDYVNRKAKAFLNPVDSRRLAELEGSKFLFFRNPNYIKFADSTMRVTENLQKYFKPYLDGAVQ